MLLPGAFQCHLLFPVPSDSNRAGSHHEEEIQVPTPILPRIGISTLWKSAAGLTVRCNIYKAGNVCLHQITFKRLKELSACVSKFLCFKLSSLLIKIAYVQYFHSKW